MVRLTKIYTRGGDGGETSLGDGERIRKDTLRVAAYGTVDETNAAIGVARTYADGEGDNILARIQNDLFDLGADLCTPESSRRSKGALRILPAQVDRLEAEIDDLNADLAPLNSFVLPGGSRLSAQLHVARTVARRAERVVVELAGTTQINENAIRYLNRLSDLLFVLSRHCNNKGQDDVLWVPGENRS